MTILKNRIVASIVSMLFLICVLTISLKLSVKGYSDSNPIYIKPDGSIDPPDTPIQRSGNLYTFITNVSGCIFVERDDIFIDGNGYWLQGDGAGYGFDLTGRNNVTITNCTIASFWIGIHTYASSNISLTNNNVRLNEGGGFQISSSPKSHIFGNDLAHNGDSAIWLGWSNYSNISSNTVSDNYAGITIISSSVFMRNNNMSSNSYNFGIEGQKLLHFINDIDTSNTVNNRPIYYWVNQQNMKVPTDAGYVAVINSTNITVENITFTNNYHGILSYFSSNLTIQNVSSFYNNYGVMLWESSNSNITGCDTETAGYCSILLQDSYNNSITESKIANNRYGIKITRSSNNRIYHNNFLNNVKQVDTDAESANVWDNGYPSGGNHWSDYAGVDLTSGPYQNLTGGDGIGDTPYTINIGNKDNYPLMEPWVIPERFTLIALLSFMIVSSLVIAYAKRKSAGTRLPYILTKR